VYAKVVLPLHQLPSSPSDEAAGMSFSFADKPKGFGIKL